MSTKSLDVLKPTNLDNTSKLSLFTYYYFKLFERSFQEGVPEREDRPKRSELYLQEIIKELDVAYYLRSLKRNRDLNDLATDIHSFSEERNDKH